MKRVKEILSRDENGREVIENFFYDERTGYQVFTTIVSRMAYHKPVDALWQRAQRRLSLREWLCGESILLLGANATSLRALDTLNEIVFRFIGCVDPQVFTADDTPEQASETAGEGPDSLVPMTSTPVGNRAPPTILDFEVDVTYRRRRSPIIADGDVTVNDFDSSNIDGGHLWLTQLNAQSSDSLGIRNEGMGLNEMGFENGNMTFGDTIFGILNGVLNVSQPQQMDTKAAPLGGDALCPAHASRHRIRADASTEKGVGLDSTPNAGRRHRK